MTRLQIICVLLCNVINVDVLINFINSIKLVDRRERVILNLDAALTYLKSEQSEHFQNE